MPGDRHRTARRSPTLTYSLGQSKSDTCSRTSFWCPPFPRAYATGADHEPNIGGGRRPSSPIRGCPERGQDPSILVVSRYSAVRIQGSCPLSGQPLKQCEKRERIPQWMVDLVGKSSSRGLAVPWVYPLCV